MNKETKNNYCHICNYSLWEDENDTTLYNGKHTHLHCSELMEVTKIKPDNACPYYKGRKGNNGGNTINCKAHGKTGNYREFTNLFKRETYIKERCFTEYKECVYFKN